MDSKFPQQVQTMLREGIELEDIPLSMFKKRKVSQEANINILFTCTSLKSESTFVKNFDLIQNDLKNLVPDYEQLKNAYFVNLFQSPELGIDSKGKELLEKNNYILVGEKINLLNIIDFIQSKPKKLRFDVIVFAQCNNLVDIFNFDVNVTLEQRVQQIKDLYDSLKQNGIIINYYYVKNISERDNHPMPNRAVRVDVQDFIALNNMYRIIVFVFLRNVFYSLFNKLDVGVYKKKRVINFNKIVMECYDEALDEVQEIYKFSFINNKFDVLTYVKLLNKIYYENVYTENRIKKFINEDMIKKTVSIFEK